MKKNKSTFIKKILNTIYANRLLLPGDSLLVGVSGGADSVALLCAMLELEKELEINIAIAHLNHDLRGVESENDCRFVESLAAEYKIKCHKKTINVKEFQKKNKLSTEDAARKVRYNFFYETADKHGYNKIATGHTSNDNAELLIMNLLRGSGNTGLSGIPVLRGKIIRPVLEISREEVVEYLKNIKTDYVNDISNFDREYLRNRIRLDLLPLIKKDYNQNIIDSLNRTSRILKEEEEWLTEIIGPLYEQSLVSYTDSSITISVNKIQKLPIAPKRRIIRKAIENIKGDLKKITLLHTDTIIELFSNNKNNVSIDLPGQIQVQKKNMSIVFIKQEENLRKIKRDEVVFNYSVHKPDDSDTIIPIVEISKKLVFSIHKHNNPPDFSKQNNKTAWIDYSRMEFPLTIRNIRPGDRFIPYGMKGSQTLKKFFSGSHISHEEKINCPLLISGNDIVWVGGHRLHDEYKIHPKSKKILKVELLLD